jgi:CRP/FNR family transcriptional regulator, cyclic AMP receptor protein
MESLVRILKEHAFFADLEAPYLDLLVGCASNVRFDRGEVIFHEGDEANQFYLVREGKTAVQMDAAGRRPITVETLGPGGILGWSWLVPPYRWRFDARAVEPVRAIALDGKCLRMKCEEDHDLGYQLLKRFSTIMAQRLQSTRLQVLEIYNAMCDIVDGPALVSSDAYGPQTVRR